MNTTLNLVLTHQWFDQTEAGMKRIEYRAITPYWMRRIYEARDTLTHVQFSRGYTARRIKFKITTIDIGPCPIPGWEGDYFRIHFTT